MEEALLDKQDIEPDKRDDWVEVHNYICAINESIEQLEHLPAAL